MQLPRPCLLVAWTRGEGRVREPEKSGQMPRLREWPDAGGGEVREQVRIFPLVSGLGNRVPDEGNVREKRLGSEADGSAAPERSLGWRQSVQGPAVGSVRGQPWAVPGTWDKQPLLWL